MVTKRISAPMAQDVRLLPNTAPEMIREGRKRILKGYALKFGVGYPMWSERIGPFTEKVDPGAFKNADMTDVRCLFNHDPNFILGRTAAGTMQIGIDSVGLWYSVLLPRGPRGQDMAEALERGDVTQSSWGFTLASDGDKWERNTTGVPVRTLVKINTVFDASPVVFPANGAATAYVSSDTAERSAAHWLQTTNDDTDRILAELERTAPERLAEIQRLKAAERARDPEVSRIDAIFEHIDKMATQRIADELQLAGERKKVEDHKLLIHQLKKYRNEKHY